MHDEPIAEIDLVVPVDGGRREARYLAREDRIVAERRNDARAETLPQLGDHLRVHVVVVIMRDEHRIDVRQVLEGNSRLVYAPRSYKGYRTDLRGPYRIDQQIAPARLN